MTDWKYVATPIYVGTTILVVVVFVGIMIYNVACVKNGTAMFEMVEQREEEEESMLEEVVVSLE